MSDLLKGSLTKLGTRVPDLLILCILVYLGMQHFERQSANQERVLTTVLEIVQENTTTREQQNKMLEKIYEKLDRIITNSNINNGVFRP